jgi:hypothetical protein
VRLELRAIELGYSVEPEPDAGDAGSSDGKDDCEKVLKG